MAAQDAFVNLLQCLAPAFKCYTEGESEEAISCYQDLSTPQQKRKNSAELNLIVDNNLAVLLAENGQFEAAIRSLEEMAAGDIRREIILFNLHRIELDPGSQLRADD